MGDILQIELSVYNTIPVWAPAGDDFWVFKGISDRA